jgi:threonine dehydrogenase-like Zn-dependent dehydrogenase
VQGTRNGSVPECESGRAGGAYGYVDMGGWIGGQAEYVMVPYADFNLLPFPDKDQAMEKIRDLTCLTDILPTGYHGCVSAGVITGWTVLIAGAGPVGLAAAASALLSTSRKAAPWPITLRRSWVSLEFAVDASSTAMIEPCGSRIGAPEHDKERL